MAGDFLTVPEITSSGYYAAPTVRWTQINAERTVLAGGRAGWIMNHMYSIGLTGCMSVIDVDATDYAENFYSRTLNTHFWYGGLDLEYIDKPENPFHYTMGVVAGFGNVTYADPDDSSFDKSDAVLVLEPKAQAIYNLTSWCRIGLGISYRYITAMDFVGMTNYDLGGMSLTGTVAFGLF